jgi:hypothetical protein
LRRFDSLVLIILFAIGCPASARDDDPPAQVDRQAAQVERWVAELTSSDVDARRRAAAALREIGPDAGAAA